MSAPTAPHPMNLLSRLRQIVMVSGVEFFGIAVGGITGLLIVNVMPKEQYAVYTFLITCMQLIMGLTDLGMGKCSLPIVGQRNDDVPWVVGVCRQIFRRRTLILVVSFVFVVPYAIYTFRQHGWSERAYLAAAAFVVASILVTLRGHYVGTVLLILRQVTALSRIGAIVTAVRFALVSTALLIPMTPYTVAFLLAATVSAEALALKLMRRELKTRDIEESRLSPEDEKRVDSQILKIVIPLIPSAVFFQVQGVITIFLASLFGTANMVADIGAFGRLALALVLLDRVANILLFPAIARTPAGPRLGVMISRVHATYLVAMFCLFLSAYFFPQYWILLLGKKYENMVPYVWMLFLSSILLNAAGLAFTTLAVRGFTEKQAFSVAVVIALQCLYLWKFGANDLAAILWFNIVTSAGHFFYQYALLFLKWPDLKRAPQTLAENPTS